MIISQISLLNNFTFTCPAALVMEKSIPSSLPTVKLHSKTGALVKVILLHLFWALLIFLLFFLFISSAMVIFRPKHLNSKFESNKEVFSGTETSFYMKKFIDETVHGMVGHMTSENEAQFKKPVCVVYFKVDYKLNPKGEN